MPAAPALLCDAQTRLWTAPTAPEVARLLRPVPLSLPLKGQTAPPASPFIKVLGVHPHGHPQAQSPTEEQPDELFTRPDHPGPQAPPRPTARHPGAHTSTHISPGGPLRRSGRLSLCYCLIPYCTHQPLPKGLGPYKREVRGDELTHPTFARRRRTRPIINPETASRQDELRRTEGPRRGPTATAHARSEAASDASYENPRSDSPGRPARAPSRRPGTHDDGPSACFEGSSNSVRFKAPSPSSHLINSIISHSIAAHRCPPPTGDGKFQRALHQVKAVKQRIWRNSAHGGDRVEAGWGAGALPGRGGAGKQKSRASPHRYPSPLRVSSSLNTSPNRMCPISES